MKAASWPRWRRCRGCRGKRNSAQAFDALAKVNSSGSERDIPAWPKYYADEETRQCWAKDFPNDVVPPHEDPPYDRDRHLPQQSSGRGSDVVGQG